MSFKRDDSTKEFNYESPAEITKKIKGKTVERVYIIEGMHDFLVFGFIDNTELRIRYDWLYEWCVEERTADAG